MGATEDLIELIAEFGFTRLEGEIYVYLLQHSPATGYAVAKGIGRSFPITYKALSSLRAKGAIMVDEGKSLLARAVPVAELLDQLERRFKDHRERTLEAFQHLPSGPADRRIYQLSTVDQVHERFRRMLSESEERVLMELFPEPLADLRDAVEETAARGIDVTARIYKPDHLEGVRLVLSPFGQEDLELFRSEWLSLFVDGRQALLAHLHRGRGGVHQATWTANLFLARAFYDYINSDLHHYAFYPSLWTATSLEELRAEYERLARALPPGGDRGARDLLGHLSGPAGVHRRPVRKKKRK
jgi:sugar-specific transcriptional regulator TrmB